MGWKANVLHPVERISSWFLWALGPGLWISSKEFSLFPVTAITYDISCSVDASIMMRVSAGAECVRCWVEVNLVALLQTEYLQIQHNRTNVKIGLLNIHQFIQRHLSAQWHRQWQSWYKWHNLHTIKLSACCTCRSLVYRGPQCVITEEPTPIQTLPHLAYLCSSFLKLYNYWLQRKHILTSLFGHNEWRTVPTAWQNVQEIHMFLVIIVQLGHDQKDNVQDYWWTYEQFLLSYTSITAIFVTTERSQEERWQLLPTGKLSTIFDKLNVSHAKFFSYTECLWCNSKPKLFLNYIYWRNTKFWDKTFRVFVILKDIYKIRVYFSKVIKCANLSMTATHLTVTGLIARLENLQHNLYMENFFHLRHYLTIHIQQKFALGMLGAKINDKLKKVGQKIKLQQGDKDKG